MNEIKKNLRLLKNTAWFIDVNLHAYIKQSNHRQKLNVLTNIGFRFYLVNELKNFPFYVFMVRCSYIKNGKNIIDIMKNLHEFLVNA
jgi:hypothetical protein